jgi:hypothetical protein
MMMNNVNSSSPNQKSMFTTPKASQQTQPLKASLPKPLRIAKALSVLMDSAIRIPFVNKTIGLDGVLGAFPIAGDILTFGVALYGLGVALHYKVPNAILARMVGNIMVDLLVGAIPLLGDVFDVFFKANRRNYALLMDYLENHMPHILYPDVIPPPRHSHGYEEVPHAAHAVVDVTPKERA